MEFDHSDMRLMVSHCCFNWHFPDNICMMWSIFSYAYYHHCIFFGELSPGFCPFLNWVTWFLVILYISYFFVYFWITIHFQICHLKIFSSGFEDFFFIIVFPKFEYSMPRYIEFFTFILNGDLWTSWTCSFGSDIISHCQQKSLKCRAWVQSQKWQNALCFQGNPFNITLLKSMPQPLIPKELKLYGSVKTSKSL